MARRSLDEIFASPQNARQQAEARMASKASVASDIGMSLAGGIQRGIAGVPMILPNLLNAAAAGPQLLGRGIADNVSEMLGVQPQPRGELWQPFYSSEDVLQALPEPLRPHDPKTTAGKVTDFVGQMVGGKIGTDVIQSPKMQQMLADNSSGVRPSPKPKTSEEIKVMAQQSYAKAEQDGGILKPSVRNRFLDEIEGMAPQSDEVRMLSGDSQFSKISEGLRQFRDKPMTLQTAKELDEFLGDQIDNFFINGSLKAEGKKLLDVQTKLRNSIENATEADVVGGAKGGFDAIKEGRKLWSASAKQRDIERIITRAELSDNPATALRSGFRVLASNPARIRGFSAKEQELIRSAAKSGPLAETLRLLGGRLPAVINLGSGGGIAQTGMLQGGSMLAREGATKVQMKQANKVMDSISKRVEPSPPPLPVVKDSSRPDIAAGFGAAGSEANYQPDSIASPAPSRRSLDEIFGESQAPQDNDSENQFINDSGDNAEQFPPEASARPLLERIAMAESSGNPNAKNPNSSASGLFQFTNGTWAQVVSKFGKQHGITMKDKDNPQAQYIMAQKLAEDNGRILAKLTGKEPTDADIYAAHVFGVTGAAKLLNAKEDRKAITLFPRKVVDANRSLFYAGGRPRTAAELYQVIGSKVEA